MFQGFEVEWLIGSHFNFFVYSTLIYKLVRLDANPEFGPAIVLASVTLLIIALVIPFQHWVTRRRMYTTVDSAFRPGLLTLGAWRWPAFSGIVFVLFILTILPLFILMVGSVMTRAGFFNAVPIWTIDHWGEVFKQKTFQDALGTTLTIAVTAGLVSPIIFSLLAYVIVRTRQRGRSILDAMIWASAAMPGLLLGFARRQPRGGRPRRRRGVDPDLHPHRRAGTHADDGARRHDQLRRRRGRDVERRAPRVT